MASRGHSPCILINWIHIHCGKKICKPNTSHLGKNMDDFLASTGIINKDDSLVKNTAAIITAGSTSTQEKATLIHDYVRDNIKFGWTPSFYEMTAHDVLESKTGYCQSKASLFVALLRAVDIPARVHFVSLDQGVLRGFVDTGNSLVDHAYSEVFIDGKWICTDSYVVDTDVYTRAQKRLDDENEVMGYGIHKDGICHWDAKSDAFVQCVRNGETGTFSLVTTDHGTFNDVADFYTQVDGFNKLTGLKRWLLPLFIRFANYRVESFRKSEI